MYRTPSNLPSGHSHGDSPLGGSSVASSYQALADQMRRMRLIEEFQSAIRPELDLEHVLRRYLEIVLRELGSTNAAIFLPSLADTFTVGGYINFDLEKSGLEPMWDELATVLAPAVASAESAITLDSANGISDWLGRECRWLDGRAIVAVPCRSSRELMAAVLFFRSDRDPFDAGAVEGVEALSTVFAGHLSKVIRIHHRLCQDDVFDHDQDVDPDEMCF